MGLFRVCASWYRSYSASVAKHRGASVFEVMPPRAERADGGEPIYIFQVFTLLHCVRIHAVYHRSPFFGCFPPAVKGRVARRRMRSLIASNELISCFTHRRSEQSTHRASQHCAFFFACRRLATRSSARLTDHDLACNACTTVTHLDPTNNHNVSFFVPSIFLCLCTW